MRILLLLLSALVLLTPTAQASTPLSTQNWKSLPILHEGRVKPIDSFARVMLKIFMGAENIYDVDGTILTADDWLAKSVFTPNDAVGIPAFRIRDVSPYGVEETENRLYSYLILSEIVQNQQAVIRELLEVKAEDWTPAQQEIMRLHENFILYTQILRSFTSILPLSLEGADGDAKNFVSYDAPDLEEQLKKIIERKGADPEKYNDDEKRVAFLAYQLKLVAAGGSTNVLLRIIPADFENIHSSYISFWEAQEIAEKPTDKQAYMTLWEDMMGAYRANDAAAWNTAIAAAQDSVSKLRLKIETLYNTLHLIQVALFLYGGVFLLVVAANLIPRLKTQIERAAFGLLGVAIATHAIHIFLRVYILVRAPVGTLYESILFVALISVMGFAFLAYRQKNSMGTLLGSLSGILLLTTAMGFAGEDNMNNLIAVLNTNFWLGTHVLCITIGYGVCFIASIMAHYWLVRRSFGGTDDKFLPQVQKNVKTLIILSLLFTTIGTILGGIWADQSWGRFWGWDPKENGALLIVLWLAWMLHGRMSGHISDTGYMAAGAFLSVVVVLAWFGVNLLSVGLHSYGFISGIAWGIGLFCAAEIFLIASLWLVIHYKGRRT